MTDIVERLRRLADGMDEAEALCIRDGADEIKRLRTEIRLWSAMMREAANEIKRLRAGGCARDQHTTQYCAELRAAVKAENEACAKEMESLARVNANRGYVTAFRIFSDAAAVIRARMEPKP